MKWMCVSMPPAVRIRPSPAITSVVTPTIMPGRHAGHHVRVAGLADAGDAAVLDADVGLVDAGPVDDQRVGDDAVERLGVGDARRPGPCRRAAPCRRRTCTRRRRCVASRSTSSDEAGVAEADACRRWSGRRCRRSAGARCGVAWSAVRRATTCGSRRGARSWSRRARSARRCRRGCRGACRAARARSNSRTRLVSTKG